MSSSSSSSEIDETPLKELHEKKGSSLGESSGESDSNTLLWSTSSFIQPRTYTRWSPSEEGVTLAWRDLSINLHIKKNGENKYIRIINNITGAVKAGSLVALMGASGVGKSTLMAALAHRNFAATDVEGDILINGRPIGDYMRQISGFMHQEDLFIGALTAWEHMKFMARLKLDRRLPDGEIDRKIEELLNYLGLTKIMHTRIGFIGGKKSLSGGERKRLSFATELLTDPPLLFCDEPTTGLDSYSAQKIVNIMNILSSKGTTVVCTIHQPSSQIFAMFSQVILLGNGRIAFMGSISNAIEFFASLGSSCPRNYNPADFFIKTLATTPGSEEASNQAVKKICDHFIVSDYAKEIDVVVQYEFHMGRSCEEQSFKARSNYKEPFCWIRFYWLIYRCILIVSRDTSVRVIKILQKIILAIIIGMCYAGTISKNQEGIQAVEGALFIFVTENTFAAMYSVMAEFPEDRALFFREYQSGLYSVGSYYFAKIFALIPGLILEGTIFVVIAYWLVGLKNDYDAFLITILIVILTLNTSVSCGIFFSILFESVPTAMTFLVPFDYVLMIVSGPFIKLSSLPAILSWAKYISWLMYATESLSIIQWDGVYNISCETLNPNLPCLKTGFSVLEKYSFATEHLNRDLWNMVFLCLIFHVLGFLCLWRKTKM